MPSAQGAIWAASAGLREEPDPTAVFDSGHPGSRGAGSWCRGQTSDRQEWPPVFQPRTDRHEAKTDGNFERSWRSSTWNHANPGSEGSCFISPKPGFNRPHPEAKAKFLRYPALAPRAQTGKGCFCWRGRPNRQPIRSNTFAESVWTWMRDLYGPRHAEAESVQSPRWGLPQTQESRRLTGSILRREQPRRSGAHLRRAGAMLACAITRSIPGLRANCDGSTFPAPQDGSGQNVGNRQRVECRTEQFSST
jgi:hypothetical protein